MQSLKFTAILLFFSLVCYGQKAPIKFGDISLDDLRMTSYSNDTSASALILADYGVSTIEYNQSSGWFKLIFERTTRIKILKKEGYTYADFEVPLYYNSRDEEKISGLKVITYNLVNGKVIETKMKSEGIFTEKSDQNLKIQKFTAPNVIEGSIIEVTYRITSDFLHYFRDWEFQSRIPVLLSEYRANIPEYFNYEKFMQGYIELALIENKQTPRTISITEKERSEGTVTRTSFSTSNISYTENNFRWGANNVAAFREEPYMTSYHDYLSKINFELSYYKFPNEPIKPVMGTWADLNKSLLESDYLGGAVKSSGFLKKIVEEITASLSTPEEKISTIYNYVKSNIEWDGRYRKFVDDNLKSLLEKKKGSAAEINLLLTAMLQKAGLQANPIILSTRNHGFVRENFALSSQFNYVICEVTLDSKSLLLDASDRSLPIHILPEHCLNGRGYRLSSENHGWVTLSAPKSKKVTTIQAAITQTGELSGKVEITNDGYFAQQSRKQYYKNGEAEYIKNFSHKTQWEIEKSEFQHMDKLSESTKEHFEFSYSENVSNPTILYINPLFYLRENENPFKLPNRVYPVDFGKASDYTVISKIIIPENYEVEEMPTSKALGLPLNAARYIYNVQITGNVINITSMLSINQPLFSQNDYSNLREFYTQVIAKQAEQIVLKKKN